MATADPYRHKARCYDRMLEGGLLALREIGLALLPPAPGMRVLDLGCGTGSHVELYRRRGCAVVGVDRSDPMLQVAARKLGPDAGLLRADATAVPLADGAVDLVLLSLALHENDEQVQSAMLAECVRVLSADGHLLVIEHHPGPARFPRGWARRLMVTLIELVGGHDHFRAFRAYMARGGVPYLADKHGLAVVSSKVVGSGTMGVFLLRRPAGPR